MFAEELKKSLLDVLCQLQIDLPEEKVVLEHPSDLAHGDFSTSIALVLSKDLGKPPRELADKIEKAWQEIGLPNFVEKIQVANPGFLNVWLKFDALGRKLAEVLNRGVESGGVGGIKGFGGGKGKTVVIDYSSPNIAKPFGIGHLRSTNIGQALYNIYKFCGWKVVGDNHLGDWGTQFGKLIYQINSKLKTQNSKLKLKKLTIEDLERLYVEFHKEAETKPEMEEEARKWFKRLEEGEPEARKIWQVCVEISLKEFSRIYDLLGVKIDYVYGESFYLDKMAGVLNDARKVGLLKESLGAKVVEIPGMDVPAMLVKSDGATTYLLRDLATIKFRKKTWNPDLYIYEVGVDQKLYFEQVFSVAEMLGYGQLSQFVHISHGLIRWAAGKFSTRRGETIHLEDVLKEAVDRARRLCETAGVAKDLPVEERVGVAKAIGIGAIKYNDLKQNPKTDIIFDWDQILTLSGNSGPYLQYTFARTQSVLRKATFAVPPSKESLRATSEEGLPQPQTPARWANALLGGEIAEEELVLLRMIYKFPEVILEAGENFSPNLLCNFLFDLAQKFNVFYDRCRILGNKKEDFRLSLTAAVGQILKNGLSLLGIESLEKM